MTIDPEMSRFLDNAIRPYAYTESKFIKPKWWRTSLLFLRHIPENSTHLDIGCGCGYLIYLATHTKNTTSVGIDSALPDSLFGKIRGQLGVEAIIEKVHPQWIPSSHYDVITIEHMNMHEMDNWSNDEIFHFVERVASHTDKLLISGNGLRLITSIPKVVLIQGI